jgi:hypothetical protein
MMVTVVDGYEDGRLLIVVYDSGDDGQQTSCLLEL